MTTMNRATNKLNKRAIRKAEKQMRQAIVAEHNASFDQRKAAEAERAVPYKLQMNDQVAWQSPHAKPETTTPSLRSMFFLEG